MKRRDFVRHSAVAATGMGVVSRTDLLHGMLLPSTLGRGIEQDRDSLAAAALNAAIATTARGERSTRAAS